MAIEIFLVICQCGGIRLNALASNVFCLESERASAHSGSNPGAGVIISSKKQLLTYHVHSY